MTILRIMEMGHKDITWVESNLQRYGLSGEGRITYTEMELENQL
jgi:hypothetical protein